MFQSVLEQKMAIAACCAKNDNIQQPSTYQLGLVIKYVDILSPTEEVTHSISARLTSISIMIPYIHVLIRTLEKNEDDSGICTMKSQILHSLRTRFTGVEGRKELALTTFDPRFEDRFFGGEYYKGYCKGIVVR